MEIVGNRNMLAALRALVETLVPDMVTGYRYDLRDEWLATPAVKAALKWRWLREYCTCAYCGKLLSWRWKFHLTWKWPIGDGAYRYWEFPEWHWHRLIEGACQCERIGGHPRANLK